MIFHIRNTLAVCTFMLAAQMALADNLDVGVSENTLSLPPSAEATPLANPENAVAHAVFAESLHQKAGTEFLRPSFGLVFPEVLGLGIVFRYPISKNRNLWVSASHLGTAPGMFDRFNPDGLPVLAHFVERDRMEIAAGATQSFPLFNSRHWSVQLGFGAGVRKADYQTSYYSMTNTPIDCGNGCRIAPNGVYEKTETDLYGFLAGCLGIGYYGANLWGTTGNLAFVLLPTIARWPERVDLDWPADEGHKKATPLPYMIEATVEI